MYTTSQDGITVHRPLNQKVGKAFEPNSKVIEKFSKIRTVRFLLLVPGYSPPGKDLIKGRLCNATGFPGGTFTNPHETEAE